MTTSAALARNISDRLGFGPRPGDLAAITHMGAERWIEQQLHPQSIPLSRDLTARLADMPALSLTPFEALRTYGPAAARGPDGKVDPERQKELRVQARFIPAQAVEARLVRAVESPRQLEEALVDFWFNHFNVFVGKGLDGLWITSYDEDAIRPHVLGRFRDLLGATAHHPAMLFYLDNWQNSAAGRPGARGAFKGLNENYARELMELHTLGVDGGYSQDDIIALARILTGWGFGGRGGDGPGGMETAPRPPRERLKLARQIRQTGGFIFSEERHDFSDKTFLGHTIKGRGEAEGDDALDILALHPATARHISFKLAQYFLADTPEPAVVDGMSRTFQKSGGDITAVLKALFASKAFLDPAGYGTKFKTPLRYAVSAVRATGQPLKNFRPLFGVLTQLGQAPYACQTPDGYKCTEDAWLNADAMTRRITFAIALCAGRLPLQSDPPDKPLPIRQSQRVADQAAQQMENAPVRGPAVDAAQLAETLGQHFSDNTRAAIDAAQPELRASLMLGGPEFMRC